MALTDKLTAIAQAIRHKTGKTATLTLDQMPSEIESITTGGSTSPDVRYVTFMNGDTLLYKKPVAVGDDCVDVLTKGLIQTPARESDAQYNYTYYGWGAEDNGAADGNILKNVTEDKTVYAIFTAAVRYYTITYYDSDGTTVLKTESLAYGATPSYKPSKEGCSFVKWSPETSVTGDASYTAVWEEAKTFADLPWERIAEISESGQASQWFKVGDEKLIYNDATGAVYAACRIIGFNHDTLSDGTGKAGISCALTCAHYTNTYKTNDMFGSGVTYPTSALRTRIQNYPPPNEALCNVVKSVTKKCQTAVGVTENIDDKFWPLSEMEWDTANSAKYTDGSTYSYYKGNSAKGIKQTYNSGLFAPVFLRSCRGTSVRVVNGTSSGTTGNVNCTDTTYSYYVHIGFCI